MTGDLLALVVGTVLAVGALGFVLYPLFFAAAPAAPRERPAEVPTDGEESAIQVLREIEFDRATGKLSDADYAALRATYAGRALTELREARSGGAGAAVDAIEARVRAYRSARRECPTCGLRPEVDAIYCSTCGAFLDRVCTDCGAEVTEPGAAYCAVCGGALVR